MREECEGNNRGKNESKKRQKNTGNNRKKKDHRKIRRRKRVYIDNKTKW